MIAILIVKSFAKTVLQTVVLLFSNLQFSHHNRMETIDNTIDYSQDDSSDDEDGEKSNFLQQCKECSGEFSSGEKGCSTLKQLCATCKSKEDDLLLQAFEENGEENSINSKEFYLTNL